MTSTSIRPSATAGPRVGYLVGAVVNVILLILVDVGLVLVAVSFALVVQLVKLLHALVAPDVDL